jgi:hypothetical protein
MKKSTTWAIVLASVLLVVCLAFAVALSACIMSRAGEQIELTGEKLLSFDNTKTEPGTLVAQKDGLYVPLELETTRLACTVAFRSHSPVIDTGLLLRGETENICLLVLKRVPGHSAEFELLIWRLDSASFVFHKKLEIRGFLQGERPRLIVGSDHVCVMAGDQVAVFAVSPELDLTRQGELLYVPASSSTVLRVLMTAKGLLCLTDFEQHVLEFSRLEAGFKSFALGLYPYFITDTGFMLTEQPGCGYQFESPTKDLVLNIDSDPGSNAVLLDAEHVVVVQKQRLVRYNCTEQGRSGSSVDLGIPNVRQVWGNYASKYILVGTGTQDLWLVRADQSKAEPVFHCKTGLFESAGISNSIKSLVVSHDGNNGTGSCCGPRFFVMLQDSSVVLISAFPRFPLHGAQFVGVVTGTKKGRTQVKTRGLLRKLQSSGVSSSVSSGLFRPSSALLYDKQSDSLISSLDSGDLMTRTVVALTDAAGTVSIRPDLKL